MWNDTRADEDVMVLVGGKEKRSEIAWDHMIYTMSPSAQVKAKIAHAERLIWKAANAEYTQ